MIQDSQAWAAGTDRDQATLHAVGERYLEACREICAAYDVAVRLGEGPLLDVAVDRGLYRSVLGVAGRSLAMTSVLVIESRLLDWTHAAMAPHGGPLDREDWCREFSNQLGGRLKNKLLPLGIEVKVGLARLEPRPRAVLPASRVQLLTFTSAKGWLRAELSMQVLPGALAADLAGMAQGDGLLEGTYLMF